MTPYEQVLADMNAKEARYKKNVQRNGLIFIALIAASFFISLWWLIPTLLFGVFALPYWLLANPEDSTLPTTPDAKMKRMMQDALWQESERQRQERNRY